MDKNIKNENNKNDKVESDAIILFRKNGLNEKAIIGLLCCMICILVAYILGTGIINSKYYSPSAPSDSLISQLTTELNNIYPQEIYVNINTDDLFELTLLPGIGEARAMAIIEYRKENGDFTDIEELKNIKGIGDSVFEELKPYIFIE